MPLYVKSHSHGEFVFDWAWAEAYARHGLDYYPKLLTAIPYSPVTGPRIGLRAGEAKADLLAEIFAQLRQLCDAGNCSGWHLLFPEAGLEASLETLSGAGLLRRTDVQFQWHNRNFDGFEDFLASLRSSRRKNLKRERRKVRRAGAVVSRVAGGQISDAQWDGFYRCYRQTYLKRSGHPGYLNRKFFQMLRATMAEQLMLVVAERDGHMLASALFLFDDRTLYGRYWGALEQVDCLHFECCFYQGIEFCIERGLEVFDPGTQGEHKLVRGFKPVETASFHWISDPRFRAAIGEYLEREQQGVRLYREQARSLLPFRRDLDCE
jgi:predicted N-acyltransferase